MSTWVPLGSVAKVDRNGINPAEISPGSLYVGLEHIESDGSVAHAPTVDRGELASTKFQFSNRHVLFGKLRPYLRKVARPSFAGVCSTDIIPILPSSRINRDYLFHFLRSDAVIERAATLSVGMNLPRLNPRDLLAFEIPLLSLNEQRRIARILDQADDLRRKRRLALEKINALLQAIFYEMFGDPIENPQHYSTAPLMSVGHVVTGRTPPSGVPGLFGGYIPFVTPGDLGTDAQARRSVSEAGASIVGSVRPGSTLVCCIGATIGKMDITSVRCAFNQQINAVEWSQDVDDLFGYVTMTFYKSIIALRGTSTTLPILKKSSFERIEIPVPPLTDQKLFGRNAMSVRSLLNVYRTHETQLTILFGALQHDAFEACS
jgi:type I restriction enzyme, S subunit